jgi:hypothetical protein
MRGAIPRAALAALRADQLRDLRFDQLLSDPPHALPHDIGVVFHQNLPGDLLDRHPFHTGHRWRLHFSSSREEVRRS